MNQVVLSLYRDGRDLPLRNFQAWALEQVRGVIAFVSAWWGNGGLAQMHIHGLRLFNCDAAMLQDYPQHRDGDFFWAALVANPGVSVNLSDLCTRERHVRTRRNWPI